MAGWMLKCFSVCVLASIVRSSGTQCPNPEIPSNCLCETHPWGGPEVKMTCTGLEDAGLLLKVLRLNANVARLHLVNCYLPYLPLGLAPHGLTELRITNGSYSFISPPMSDRSCFDGLTNLTSIIVKGVADLSAWDWSKLKPLKNLQLIHVEDSRLPELPSTMSALGESFLWTLNVTNSQLLHVASSALASKTLSSFATRGNPLRTLRKDMHNSNKAIKALEIIGTKITHLENGFLRELNDLRSLVTDANFLSYMTSQSFYNTPQLHYFALVGEPPQCSCRYSFLLNNGLRWMEECTLKATTQTHRYLLAEFLHVAC